MSTVLGPIVGPAQVEQAAEATLRAWLPTYLAELERRGALAAGSLPEPVAYQVVSDIEHLIEQALGGPVLVLVSPGVTDTPPRRETGFYAARWTLNAVVVVPAESRARARELAGLYATAARAVLVQKATLGGFALATDWIDEEYVEVATDDRRVLAAGRVEVAVEVAEVLDAHAGPSAPSTEPHPDWPTVSSAEIELTKEAP